MSACVRVVKLGSNEELEDRDKEEEEEEEERAW